MIRTWAYGAIAALWAATAIADTCPSGKVPVLHCDIRSDKALTVCIGDGEASYEYGLAGKPELALTQPLGQVVATPWPGAGRSIWEEIVFFNNDVSYGVWISIDRDVMPDPMSGGVLVKRGDQTLADLRCLDGTAEVTAFAISDGFEQAGFCWDFDAQRFARDCAN